MKTLQLSPLVMGTMRLGIWGVNMNTLALEQFIQACIEFGLNDFDHADIYGDYTTEEDFGKVLKGKSSLRDQLKLTTKCGIKMISGNRPSHKIKSYDSSADHIIASAERSLKNLHTDRIDLFLIHRPDFLMNPVEIAKAVDQLKGDGKILHFGVSNFSNSQIKMLNEYVNIENHQVEASPLFLDPFKDGTFDVCWKRNIVPTIWSPFGGGALFDQSIEDERTIRIRGAISVLCEKYSATKDQIILSWLRSHPLGLIPILGTSKISRVGDAVKALEISITREEWYMIWEASTGHEVA